MNTLSRECVPGSVLHEYCPDAAECECACHHSPEDTRRILREVLGLDGDS